MGQASNTLWLELHGSTITSSNFKKVFRWQSAYTLFFDSMIKQDNIGHLPAIAHGKVEESHAGQLYVNKMQANGRNDAVQECGLCLHQVYLR